MSKLVVKSGNTHYRSRGNLCELADPLESLLRQKTKVALDGLQNLQHLVRSGADSLNSPIHKCQIQLVHQSLFGSPMLSRILGTFPYTIKVLETPDINSTIGKRRRGVAVFAKLVSGQFSILFACFGNKHHSLFTQRIEATTSQTG
jgi:hypothetical protein